VFTGLYAAEKEFNGYLCDVACGSTGKDPAENVLNMNNEKHTIECMKSEPSRASGYGIFIKE
jgi:hypothetical protein